MDLIKDDPSRLRYLAEAYENRYPSRPEVVEVVQQVLGRAVCLLESQQGIAEKRLLKPFSNGSGRSILDHV